MDILCHPVDFLHELSDIVDTNSPPDNSRSIFSGKQVAVNINTAGKVRVNGSVPMWEVGWPGMGRRLLYCARREEPVNTDREVGKINGHSGDKRGRFHPTLSSPSPRPGASPTFIASGQMEKGKRTATTKQGGFKWVYEGRYSKQKTDSLLSQPSLTV